MPSVYRFEVVGSALVGVGSCCCWRWLRHWQLLLLSSALVAVFIIVLLFHDTAVVVVSK